MTENAPQAGTTGQDEQAKANFNIQSIFVKDLSYEAPNVPAVFQEQYKPNVSMELNSQSRKLADDVYEVILSITLTAKNEGDKTVFLVEVHQGGVFTIKGLDEKQLHHALGAYCPNILFPYARETISNVVNRGGFPQLLLAPVNFDNLYLQQMQKQAEAAQKGAENGAGEASA